MEYDDGSGSFYTYLPAGCRQCHNGEKMVLFVTGLCNRDCYYCPISVYRNRKDVVFANERPVTSDMDILDEGQRMRAMGTGITGGEPLLVLDRVLDYIALLKQAFGQSHHIHLYTAQPPSREVLEQLRTAGLDEIRLHPPQDMWDSLSGSGFDRSVECARSLDLDIGFEIPAIAGAQHVAAFARDRGVFLNLNEMEFSDTNSKGLRERGHVLHDDVSCGAEGSDLVAREVMELYPDLQAHFCSSCFKDRVQLRRRLLRIAGETAREFDEITPDGTLFYGVVKGDVDGVVRMMMDLDVPGHLFELSDGRVELAWWVLQEIGPLEEGFEAWYEECYPTCDRMVVERIPLYTEESPVDRY